MPETTVKPPSSAATIFHGAWRFTVASLAAFSFWAFGGRFLKPLGAVGLDLVCTVVFILLGSLLLHPLIKTNVPLKRFFGIFAVAFAAYACVWMASWYGIKGRSGEIIHCVIGPVTLAILLLRLTKTHPAGLPLLLAIVVLHSLGYFAGDSLYAWAKSPSAVETLTSFSKAERHRLGQMLWGLTYGLGLGSAIGLLLYQIASESPKPEPAPAA